MPTCCLCEREAAVVGPDMPICVDCVVLYVNPKLETDKCEACQGTGRTFPDLNDPCVACFGMGLVQGEIVFRQIFDPPMVFGPRKTAWQHLMEDDHA